MDKSQKNAFQTEQIVAHFSNAMKSLNNCSELSDNGLLREGICFANTALNLHGGRSLTR